MIDLEGLRSQANRRVQLAFKDGEVVEALLLAVDPVRDKDLTYEIERVVRVGSPPAVGTKVGATCIARLDDLANWTPLTD